MQFNVSEMLEKISVIPGKHRKIKMLTFIGIDLVRNNILRSNFSLEILLRMLAVMKCIWLNEKCKAKSSKTNFALKTLTIYN